jgi:hypothetical protein
MEPLKGGGAMVCGYRGEAAPGFVTVWLLRTPAACRSNARAS